MHGAGNPTEIHLPEGRLVDRQKYATHLRRRVHESNRYVVGRPSTIRPPQYLYAVESLLASARTHVVFQRERAAASHTDGTLVSSPSRSSAYGAVRKDKETHWDQWMSFSYSIKDALEKKRFNDALVLVR